MQVSVGLAGLAFDHRVTSGSNTTTSCLKADRILDIRALRSCYGMASRHRPARSTLSCTTSQTVHPRRHSSQFYPDGVDEERPHSYDDQSRFRVVAASARRPPQTVGFDELNGKYVMHEVEDATDGTSKYQLLFNDFGFFFMNQEGERIMSRRNVL